MTHPGGRLTKYYPELCEELREWFEVEPVSTDDKGNKEIKELPTLTNFARSKKVNLSTIYNWKDSNHDSFHPEFLEAYKSVKKYQKEFLLQNGLAGRWNSNFAKFVAVNLTDMSDKQDVDVKTGGEKINTPEETLRRIAFLLRKGVEDGGKE